MADKSVYLNFGADTAKFEADLARANAAVRATAREMQRLAAEMQKTGAAADSELGQKLTAAGTRLGQAKAQATAAREELSKIGGAGAEAAKGVEAVGHASGASSVQLAESIHVVKALFDEVAAGQNPMRALAIEGGRIFQILSMGVSASVVGWGALAAGVLAAAGSMYYLVVQAQKFRETSDQLRTSSAFGGLGLSKSESDDVVKQLAKISGLSWKEAQDTAAAFGAMQAKSAEVFGAIAADLDGFAKATGDKPAEAAKKLIALFDDPSLSADQLAKALGRLSDAQRAQYELASQSGNPLEREAALQAILAAHIADSTKVTLEEKEAQLAAAQAHKRRAEADLQPGGSDTNYARGSIDAAKLTIKAIEKEIADLREANDEAAKMAGLIRNSASAADQLRIKFDQVLESVTGASEAAKTASNIDTLRAGIQGATGDAAALIRQFEGFGEVAKFDVNHYRAGYGSSTKTSASGAVSSLGAGDVVSREDAERDLARRIADIQAGLQRQLGASWEALSDKARASLTSISYNYGDNGYLPANVLAAARGGDEKAIADAIAARAGDNGGVNAGRRAQEAANITRDYAAVRDPAKVGQARDAIGDLADQQRKRDDARNGGGAVDRAELANIEAEVAGRADAVEQQRRLVAAREQELSLSQGVTARAEAEKALAQARVELRTKENAATESGLRLDADRLKGGDDVKAAEAAELKLADFRIAQAGADVAARNAAVGEKEAIEQRYADQARQISIQSAQQRIADAREETQATLRELELQLKAQEITQTQKIALTQAAYARERATVVAAYQSELQLEDMRPRDRQRIGHEIETAERDFAQRTRQTQLEAADATQRAWNDATKQISSAFDSQIPGLLNGTTSWANAARNVLAGLTTDIVKFFVNWGVQDAANFAKHMAINAGWLASDTATQTAATASHVAGAAAQKAVDASTVQGDAARAAAGAYAAVAGVPLIGPVLAPAAAAAAYAGTLAFSSFDIGAYNIPNDQLAMVHRNELVMPAAQAGAFRAMLESAPTGGGMGQGGGVTVAPQMHFHSSAIDSSGLAGMWRNNGGALMKAVEGAVRDGAHLGLRRIGR